MINYAIKDGNWTDSSTWKDGIVPTENSTVYTNGFIVNIDLNEITAKELSNCADENIVKGGMFAMRLGGTINANLRFSGKSALDYVPDHTLIYAYK